MISLNRSSFSHFLHFVMFSVIFLLVFSRPLSAQETPDAIVRELSEDIKVDGILDESSWKEVPSIGNLTQVEPHPFESPTEQTKVWLAYNKDALYIAVLCEDRNPDKIVATEMRRDARLSNNDNIDIILDTYHDRRNAYNFSTNAVGALRMCLYHAGERGRAVALGAVLRDGLIEGTGRKLFFFCTAKGAEGQERKGGDDKACHSV